MGYRSWGCKELDTTEAAKHRVGEPDRKNKLTLELLSSCGHWLDERLPSNTVFTEDTFPKVDFFISSGSKCLCESAVIV